MDPKAQRAAMHQAATTRTAAGGEPELVTAVPAGTTGPPGWKKIGQLTPEGYQQKFDIYATPDPEARGNKQQTPAAKRKKPSATRLPRVSSKASPPGVDASKDIDKNFLPTKSPDGTCVSCLSKGFLHGVVEGAVFGFIIAFALALITTPAMLMIAVTGLVGLAAIGIWDLAQRWSGMTAEERQYEGARIFGNLVGGGATARAGYKGGRVVSKRLSTRSKMGKAGKAGTPNTPKTVDDILQGATPGQKTKGRSKQYEKSGGAKQANADFDALGPSKVQDRGNGMRTGELPGGRKAVVRSKSTDRRATLEIQKGKNKTKVRYNDK